MDVLLFKTNIKLNEFDKLRKLLDVLPGISQWTIDLEDCDKVLRIVTKGVSSHQMQWLLRKAGFPVEPMVIDLS